MIETSKKAAQSESNVLILGESGTGKELIAQSIHNASSVAAGPFVAINCAAIPNSLVESELFGYEKGAFTGAEKEGRPGKFEMADGGTIFLDEIGDMPYAIQSALLRVLQTKEVVRIGGKYPKPVNIRVIAATNQDLNEAVAQKTFREDLFYRLNVFTISVPPLRERGGDDIALLASHFVDIHNKKKHTAVTIAPEVFSVLRGYSWPGNVRQLENAVERAICLCSEDIIKCEDLPSQITQAVPVAPESTVYTAPSKNTVPQSQSIPQEEVKEESSNAPQSFYDIGAGEAAVIVSALESCGGNVTATAKALGINLRTLYRKINKYNIDIDAYRHKR